METLRVAGHPLKLIITSELAWLRSGWDTKYVYSFTWLGRPIIQLPEDMVRLQEVIFLVGPDVIVETGIDTGIHWQPGHWFTLLKDCRRGDLSVTDRVGHEVLSLPLHSMMSAETLDLVVEGVAGFFGGRA